MPATRSRRGRNSRAFIQSSSASQSSEAEDGHEYIGRRTRALTDHASRRFTRSDTRPHANFVGTHPSALLARWREPVTTVFSSYVGTPLSELHAEASSIFSDSSPRSESGEDDYDDSASISASEVSSATSQETPSTVDRFPVKYYDLAEDEEPEDDLIVHGETPGEEAGDDSLPIRLLKNFTIYEVSDRYRIVPFSADFGRDNARVYGASGNVEAYVQSDSEDPNDDSDLESDIAFDSQDVCLPRILEVSVHSEDESKGRKIRLDPKIYLKTDCAWYILDKPSEEYFEFYAPFWTKHFIFHTLVTSAASDKTLSYSKFLSTLEKSPLPLRIINESINAQHMKHLSTRGYVVSMLEALRTRAGHLMRGIDNVPAILEISKPRSTKPPKAVKYRARSDKRSAHPTVVTHKVHALCKDLFPLNDFMVCGRKPREPKAHHESIRHRVHKGNPSTIRWVKDGQLGPNHYRAVVIDGVTYEAGDTVIIERGEDANKKRAAASNEAVSAHNTWFSKICYFFHDEVTGEDMFHGQWYEHGSQTLLQEIAHPQSLFLIDECDDQSLNVISQKCDVRILEPTEDEPPYPGHGDKGYFTGLVWDQDNSIFLERREKDIENALEQCPRDRPCVSCGVKHAFEQAEKWEVSDDGALVHGTTRYHVDDVVYIRPLADKTDVYTLGQITEIVKALSPSKGPTIDVQLYERYDLIARRENREHFGNVKYDERRLYQSEETCDGIDAWRIEGKAYVEHPKRFTPDQLEEWLSHDDHFYVDVWTESYHRYDLRVEDFRPLAPHRFKPCKECKTQRLERIKEDRRLLQSNKSMRARGLELFAGAGGLSSGLDQSGFVQTKWAVEMDSSAVLSYKENHPSTTVYNSDVNLLLKHAIETFEGKKPKKLLTATGSEIPPMPQPGEVDFIYGGPPCQGFSGMNHSKKVDDPRNTLACNMLSFVDFYRPSYFLLENVDALLYAKLKAEQDGAKQVGGIKNGMIKFILRTLTMLGYQAHCKVLQAGQYGSPQSRLRIIFWGAKRTLSLPNFPVPTHCTPDDVDKYKLPTKQRLWPAVRVNPDSDHLLDWLQFAPLLPVTVEDAISDLPKFDWIDPHIIIPFCAADEHEILQRSALDIKRAEALSKREKNPHCGYPRGGKYTEPLSRYQKWMRAKMRPEDDATYQYTATFGPKVVERTCNVPFKKDSNHADLPKPLRLEPSNYDSNGKSAVPYRSLFGRIDAKGPFSTALTTASPAQKGGRVLHPTQKRILTVREFARSQGFPDHQVFLSLDDTSIETQYKQIGNAVPVPLALALGKALGDVFLKKWEDEDDQDDDAREQSPEIPMEVD